MVEENSLVIFTQAALMLADANTIQKAKELKNLALTAADWAKRKGMGNEAIAQCRTYALEAERKMGEMLAATKRAKGQLKEGPWSPPVTTGALTLTELGISKKESSQAQAIAALPEKVFNDVKSGRKTKTKAVQEVKRGKKEAVRETRREENRVKVATVAQPEQIIETGAKFATIVIDPPWDWGDEGDVNQMGRAKPDYATMPIEQIAGLPVADLADVDCHLYVWITNRSLPKGFALLEQWGFRFITVLTWVKPSFGLGNYFRGQTEHVLFGVKGSQMLKRKDVGTVFNAPRGPNGHSSKPEEFYKIVESCSPGPYLEMFSRVNRDGWAAWGEGR